MNAAWDDSSALDLEAVEEAIRLLDRGEARVAEKHGDDWVVHEWLKKAILLYFRLRRMEPVELGPFAYHDKILLKRDHASRGVSRAASNGALRRVPLPGRSPDAELREHRRLDRPAHDGRHLGDGRVVRADRRRRAPGRRRRHRCVSASSNASAQIVENGAFIGSRCIVTEGTIVGEGAVLGANVTLTATIPVIDVTSDEPRRAPRVRSAALGRGARDAAQGVSGRDIRASACALIVGRRSEATDLRTSLNDALREHGVAT